MSFQSRNDRRRELASSPPLTIQKGRSADNLDAILLKQSSQHAAELCFGYCRPFRNNPKYSLSPTFKPIRGGSQPRLARDWKSASLCASPLSFSPSPLSLTKAASMPELYGNGPPSPLSPAVAERNVWKCKGCNQGGTHRLVANPDGGLSCVCGTVAEGVDMVSLERAKNCHKDDDPTQVGEVQAQSAAQTAPWRDGPVSKEERQRRENAQLGGTRVSNPCARKNDMQQAQREVERQARKDAEELCRTDAPDQGRGQKLLDGLELAFGKMPALRDDMPRVASHIRLEAIRIYQLSVRHERACGCTAARRCTYALSSRHMVVLTLGIIELVLSQLAGIESGDGRLVDEITQGNNNYHDLDRALTQLYQLQEDQNIGVSPRLELLSAVHFISKWKPGDELFACTPSDFSSTHPHWLPDARRNSPGEFGKSVASDPGDTTEKLRVSLKAVVKMIPMDTATKEAVAYQLQVPAVVERANLEGLPRDVVAVAIVAATALKRKKDDPTHDLRRHLFRPLHISSTTIDDFISRLDKLIELPPDSCAAQKAEEEARDRVFDTD